MNTAEERVSKFYNTVGWETEGGITEDAKRWEDLRPCADSYVRKCRRRVKRHIPEKGKNILDMASGPIQYSEYLEYSQGYEKRYCVDLSKDALKEAERKIGDHGVFLHGSFFDVSLEEDLFDCSISLHTIYHIDKDKQEAAVQKLLDVTKPGKPVIIVYSNPNTILRSIKALFRSGKPKEKTRDSTPAESGEGLYFYAHPLHWWRRFGKRADISILPWRSFSADIQKKIFPDNRMGKWLFKLLFLLEEILPRFFARHFTYPMIILRSWNNSRKNI